jgi:pectin methylesterase-like acyl-CoA thioesterase
MLPPPAQEPRTDFPLARAFLATLAPQPFSPSRTNFCYPPRPQVASGEPMNLRRIRCRAVVVVAAAALVASSACAAQPPQAPPAPKSELIVDAAGSADFKTVQQAVDALPGTGGTIRIRRGTYREQIHVDKPHVTLIGLGKDPSAVVLTFNLSHHDVGTTFGSASTTVTANDFLAENLTFQNTFSDEHPDATVDAQAVALRVTGDRDVFRHVRLLAYQDTLYADSAACHQRVATLTGAVLPPGTPPGTIPAPVLPPNPGRAPATWSHSGPPPCQAARQLFTDSYIAGTIDFIFGDAKAAFVRCEIRSRPHQEGTLTAQSRFYSAEDSAYVFDHCRLTADPGVTNVFLGRPWRPYSTVVFLNTEMGAQIQPAGWLEWPRNGAPSLNTSYYAEYRSTGPGAPTPATSSPAAQSAAPQAAAVAVPGPNGTQRVAQSKILTSSQAKIFAVRVFLRGADNWHPKL